MNIANPQEIFKPQRRLIKAKEAAYILGVSNSTFWRMANGDDEFPDEVRLTERRCGWFEDEIIRFAESRRTSNVTKSS